MRNKRLRNGIIAGLLLFLSAGSLFTGPLWAAAGETDSSDVNRGLSGKKGAAAENDTSKKTAESLKDVEVYKDHLDTVIMIYMCGSNLESQNGLGTADLHEICEAYKKAGKSDQPVKFIVQTGGCNEWYPDFNIPADKSMRYEIDGEELKLKQQSDIENMANPRTLSDFISWGMAAYPADRYGLILWDHGGGSVLGFGADEIHSGSMMRLQQLKKAFETADCHFSFIGFDACLMGTVEIAYMLRPFADYMIASEEMEPGNGWYYTNWAGTLLKDPKASVETFGKQIVDDFAGSNEKNGDIYTLSLIDLSKIEAVYKELMEFAGQSEKELETDKYAELSKARSEARDFGNGGYEQIDIIDYVDRAGVKGGDSLKKYISDALVYFKTNIKNANGLAMYYPYQHLEQYSRMDQLLETLKFDKVYRDYFSGFCTVRAQSDEATKNGSGYVSEKWYRTDMEREYEKEALAKLPVRLPYKKTGGKTVIDIPPEELDKMTYGGMTVWLDTGTDYVEMGVEHWWGSNIDEYVEIVFENIWITINNAFVPFYMQDMGIEKTADGKEFVYEYGYVPAVLTRTVKPDKSDKGINGDKGKDQTAGSGNTGTGETTADYIWIRVEIVSDPFTDEDKVEDTTGTARVCGYWIYEDMEFEGGDSVRNLQQLREGDELDFVASLYNYDGEYEGFGQMGDTLTVPKDGLEVSYSLMSDAEFLFNYTLEDVYGNTYYTDWIRTD
ncbi:MAG: hypothetical protein K5770_19855 [Lachnospiraceae bacterium]|nr:hypothetical protein [Lachnospiraceae bacterium]